MRLIVLVALLVACHTAPAVTSAASASVPEHRVDPEIADAVVGLRSSYQLMPRPIVGLMLAVAYERADDIARARTTINRIDVADLPPGAKPIYDTFLVRLAGREHGSPRTDDEVLDRQVIAWANKARERRDRLDRY